MTLQPASQMMRRSIAVSMIAVGIMATSTVSSAVAIQLPVTIVQVHASSYSPNLAEQDFIVSWSFRGLPGSTTRSVTDSSGMNLFDSGPRGSAGAAYAFRFWGAGTYPYHSSNLTSMKGTIADSMSQGRAKRTHTPTFIIGFGGTRSPSFREDVQIKPPGATSFQWWRYGTRAGWATFVPAKPGVYLFRARLRRIRTGKTSLFSPPLEVKAP